MAPANLQTGHGSWSVPEHPLVIEYAVAVLEGIRLAAVEGFNRMRRGGLEVGGVLFGTRQDNTVRILAFRPLVCEYAAGPSFVLSDKDRSALRELLETIQSDPGLRGFEPLGWYHSHTRSEIFLSDRDLEIFDQYFPHPWQVALVARPANLEPTRFGFFLREQDGSIRSHASYREFTLPSPEPAERAIVAAASPAQIGPALGEALSRLTPAPDAAPEYRPSSLPVPLVKAQLRQVRQWALLLAIPVLLLAVGLAAYWLRKPADRLSLTTVDSNGQLRIEWDRTAEPIRNARNAWLLILDGDAGMQLELDAEHLRKGNVIYARRSGNVTVRLRVQPAGGRPIDDVAHFVGPVDKKRLDSRTEDPARRQQLEREAEAMRVTLEAQKKEVSRLEEMVNALGSTSAAPSEAKPPAAPASRPTVLRNFQPPQRTQPSVSAALPSPPSVSATTTLSAPPPVAHTMQLPGPPPAPKPAPAEPAKRRPLYSGPSSGRIFWSGRLAREGVVTIDSRYSTLGAVSGELPGVPVRITAFHVELTSQGITLYSTNPKHSFAAPEAPGPQNGWNKTAYIWDPQRAGAIAIVEAPGPRNGWKRVVLRSEAPKMSVILLEWGITGEEK